MADGADAEVEVDVDVAVDAVDVAARGRLPELVAAAVGRQELAVLGVRPLGQPVGPLVEAGVGQEVATPVEVRVDARGVAGLVDAVAECGRHLAEHPGVVGGGHVGVLQVEVDGVAQAPATELCDDGVGLVEHLLDVVGLAVAVDAIGDAERVAGVGVLAPLRVDVHAAVLAGALVPVVDADDRKRHVVGLDGVPVDVALVVAHVDATRPGAVDGRGPVRAHVVGAVPGERRDGMGREREAQCADEKSGDYE